MLNTIACQVHRVEMSENKNNMLECHLLRSWEDEIVAIYYLKKGKSTYISKSLPWVNVKKLFHPIINVKKTLGCSQICFYCTAVVITVQMSMKVVHKYSEWITLLFFGNCSSFWLESWKFKVTMYKWKCMNSTQVLHRVKDENNLVYMSTIMCSCVGFLVDVSSAVTAIRNMFAVLNKLHMFIDASSKGILLFF